MRLHPPMEVKLPTRCFPEKGIQRILFGVSRRYWTIEFFLNDILWIQWIMTKSMISMLTRDILHLTILTFLDVVAKMNFPLLPVDWDLFRVVTGNKCLPRGSNENVLFRWFNLHLNHLIASHTANYDWPFGTLPFGLFGSNLDTRDLETYPRTYSGHFWNMSIFDNSRAFWILFRKWVVSENQSFLDEGAIVTPLSV